MTNRTFLTWQILDGTMRAFATSDIEKRKRWFAAVNEAKRARGDFDVKPEGELLRAEKSEAPTSHNP